MMEKNEVDIVTCKGSDLLSFDKFISTQERNRVGWNSGFFKVVIDPLIERQTPPSVILEHVRNNLKTVHMQRIVKGTPSDIFQWKSTPAKSHDFEQFKNTDLAAFSEETCCLQQIQSNYDVGAHCNDFLQCSAVCSSDMSLEKLKEHYLREGAKRRKLYEDDRLPLDDSEISVRSQCLCLDCCSCPRTCNVPQRTDVLYGAGIVLKNTKPILISGGFSLSTMKNILNMDNNYKGLNIPYFYMGSKHSFSPLHIEPGLLWSISYLHFGLPKIWIIIPPRATLALNYHLSKCGLALGNTSCWNILGHKTIIPTTQWLKDRLIPFEVVIQNPGEAIILYPNAPHFGFNCGWNLAQSINFATESWILEGLNAPKCICLRDLIHLDMGLFVAAFKPEILDKFLSRTFVESERTKSSLRFFNETIMKLIQKENGIGMDQETGRVRLKSTKKTSLPSKLMCPAEFCKQEFVMGASLFNHVIKKHQPILNKCNLLEKVVSLLDSVKKR